MFASCGNIDNPLEILDTSGSGGGGGGVEETSNQYYKWDGTQLAAVDIPAGAIEITAATTELAGGVYIVKGDITLSAIMLKVTGDSELILCDGTELKVNGPIEDSTTPSVVYKLSIYGQKNNTGKLTVNANDANGLWVKDLDIHGGDISITASATFDECGILVEDNINIYGGKLEATGDMAGIENISGSSQFKIYGGDVTAIGRTCISINNGGWGIQADEITVSGTSTKLTAKGGDGANGTGTSPTGGNGAPGITGNVTVSGTATVTVTGGKGGDGLDNDNDGDGGDGGYGIDGDLDNASPNVTITGGDGGNAGTPTTGTNYGGAKGTAISGTTSGSTAPTMTDGNNGSTLSVL